MFFKKAKSIDVPEDYWINRGKNVIGNFTVEEIFNSRQIDTYNKISHVVKELCVSQVADLGCNISITGIVLRELGYTGEYIGVDANPFAIDVAKKNQNRYSYPFRIIEENLRKLSFSNEEFESVILKDVLEHMENFEPIFSEALRVASKYVLVSNFIPWTEGEEIINKEAEGYYHNLYSRKAIYNAAENFGFTLLKVVSCLEKDARPNEIVIFKRVRSH